MFMFLYVQWFYLQEKNETQRETYVIRKQNKIKIKEKKCSAKDNARKNMKKPKCISHGFVKPLIVSYQIIGKQKLNMNGKQSQIIQIKIDIIYIYIYIYIYVHIIMYICIYVYIFWAEFQLSGRVLQ